MSDSDLSPCFPFAQLLVSHGEPAGFSSPQDSGSRPRDHVSQVPLRSQGGHTRTCAQHSCGPPQLSLHGLGHPTPTSEVFHTSHRDGVQTIHCRSHLPFTATRSTAPLQLGPMTSSTLRPRSSAIPMHPVVSPAAPAAAADPVALSMRPSPHVCRSLPLSRTARISS